MSAALLQHLGPEFVGRAARVQSLYERELRTATAGLASRYTAARPAQLYNVLPWLLRDAVPAASEADCETIAVAGLLYFQHVLVLDHAVDGDVAVGPADLFVSTRLHERALTLLAPRVGRCERAWEHLAGYAAEYAAAVLGETARGRVAFGAAPSLEEFVALARGKSAILKASGSIVACIADGEALVPRFDAMADDLSVAVQALDDLEDWEADLSAGRPGYLTRLALHRAGATAAATPSRDEVAQLLFHSDQTVAALRDVATYASRSASAAREVGAHGWAKAATLFVGRIVQVADGFERLQRRARTLSTTARLGPALQEGMARAAAALIAHERAGHHEARHTMRFGRDVGFTGTDDLHHGDVFSRAIIGWAYERLRAVGCALPAHVVSENLTVLLSRRLTTGRGGWSYFPTLPELPPDSDDLAQVMHAALAMPAALTADDHAAIDAAIAVALEAHHHPDGSVDTWLLDPAVAPATLTRWRTAIAEHWGRGVDVEVVANFWMALLRWDATRYSEGAAAGARFVSSAQAPDGTWHSTWYVGPYYGAFVAARLLSTALPDDPARARMVEHLRRSRRSDGGWGTDDRSDALSTAFAALALAHSADVSADVPALLAGAARYLLLAQRGDGRWRRADFIRMETSRATDGPSRILTYASDAVTTAYAGAALAEAWRVLEAQ